MENTKIYMYLSIAGLGLLFAAGCSRSPEWKSLMVNAENSPRSELLFDFDWRFHRGDIQGPESVSFDDSDWRSLNLPHDWSIEDIPGTGSPIDSNAVGGIDMGYLVGGTSWYRKTFNIPSSLQDKQFHLQFDGVYMNAEFWLNGKYLGNHPYGYTSFWYDITPELEFGKKNVLAVRVKNEGENSRWYSGSGIYRHVWLSIMEPVHVAHWGSYITVPEVTESGARVNIETSIVNKGGKSAEVMLLTRILDKDGSESARAESGHTLNANESMKVNHDLQMDSPMLWSPGSPSLYTAVTEIFSANSSTQDTPLDRTGTTFGVRTISFDAESGFLLNGVPVLLFGGCVHHDNGPLGSAAYDRAEERRVELLKKSGYNAIRCAHNPPSPAFLDACDRLGMLVIDEAFDMWRIGKNPQDYHLYFDEWWQKDLESMIFRDRNHPSIIMWSTGNEIPERGDPEGTETARMMAEHIRSLDKSRPVTAAVNSVNKDKDPFFEALDICGYNYSWGNYKSDHKRLPDRVIYASESFPLDAFDYWMAVLDNPHVIGDFVWTSFDYLGESSIGWMGYPHNISFYPWTHAYCGDIDICGFKRPQSHYRDALWENGPNVSLFVKPPFPSFEMHNPEKPYWSKWEWQDVVADWTWPGYEGQDFEIEVYSSCEQVELFINDKSLGKKVSGRDNKYITRWTIPYEHGTLKAIAYEGTQEIASGVLKTAGEVSQIRLSADRTRINADGQDLSYVIVELTDNEGTRNPKSIHLVNFEIEGPGSILAVGSSNPMGTESFKLPFRKAYQGRCLVVIKSDQEVGDIKLLASADGLRPAEIIISSIEYLK